MSTLLYSPDTPPVDQVPDVTRWVYEELQRISEATRNYPAATGILQGIPDPVAIDSVRIIVNWPNEYEGTAFEGRVDPAAGTITAPLDGLYNLNIHLAGSHSTSTQNEALTCFLRLVRGGQTDTTLIVWPISTNKQTGASLTGNLALALQAGDILSLGLYATTNLGTFTFVFASFELRLHTLGRNV